MYLLMQMLIAYEKQKALKRIHALDDIDKYFDTCLELSNLEHALAFIINLVAVVIVALLVWKLCAYARRKIKGK